MEIMHSAGDRYKVTGCLVNGKRFNAIHTTNPNYALAINLYRGNVWQSKGGVGKWVKIKTVFN
jgi:hypothetical protein